MRYAFKNDYSEGCHPKILEALSESNLKKQEGYGADEYSEKARDAILKELNSDSAKIYFISGGTQANLTVISSILRPYESVVAAESGHIFTNETGAVEATGHKVHSIAALEGKIDPDGIQSVINSHPLRPHQLKQKLVYISNATEVGTIYCRKELESLSKYCKENELYLYLDGARLGQALAAENNDVTFPDLARLVDVFYIGGTKNGALLGEAVVITNQDLQEDFEYNIKQRGAMLAKGRLLGIQFHTLFTNNLYFELAQHANKQAMKIQQALIHKNFQCLTPSTTNQIFPILKNTQIEILFEKFDFYKWKKINETYSAIRIITSWATDDNDVKQFIKAIGQLD